MLQEVDEIAAVAASGIEHSLPRIETPAQDLIEEIDVDVAELLPQVLACCELSHSVAADLSWPERSRRQTRRGEFNYVVVEDAGVCAGAGGAPGPRGICSAVNRGSRSFRIARWYTAAAITIADFFTSSSTTRS